MNIKTVALGIAGVGALAAFGVLKWKLLARGNKWWAIVLGGLLFAATTTSAATGGEPSAE